MQFRNYVQEEFLFSERVVGICGSNGSGKTNLLDGIYYLSFSKSYFSRPDAQNVHHGLQGMRLEGRYELDNETIKITCILRENNRKELAFNDEVYKKFSAHIGRLPCVMIAPDDVVLVAGSSGERRTFLDTLMSQLSAEYLSALIDYTRLLQQRNGLLKLAAETGRTDETLLSVLDTQMCEKGGFIYGERSRFLAEFLPLAAGIYLRIAGSDNGLTMRYESQLMHQSFTELLAASRAKDMALQRTTAGVHRDDLLFFMGDAAFRTEASQGQRKSLLFALKLAEWQTLKEKKGFTPILLLDDVFEKLDEQRMSQLLSWVCTETDGQVFITDTHPARLRAQLAETGAAAQIIDLTKS